MLGPGQARSDPNRDLAIAGLAGLAAAIVGGLAWGLIVRWTDREICIAAWAIGGLVGTVVARTEHRRGLPYQLVAVVCAALGVLLGKYLEVAWQEVLPGTGIRLGVFSSDTWSVFTDSDSGVWSWYDALWFGLAVFTAYRIPGLRALTPQAEPAASAATTGPPDWATRPSETADDSESERR